MPDAPTQAPGETPGEAPAEAPVVDVLYDYVSPFSYLAHVQLPGFAARTGATLRLRPVLLGGLHKATGNAPPMMEPCAAKRTYLMRTLDRWAALHAPRFRMNPHFPMNSITAMRTAVAAQRAGVLEPFHEAMFRAFWEEGRDMADAEVIAAVIADAGLDAPALLEAAAGDAVKAALREATEAAAARGVFGAPAFLLGDELFWGQDHLPLLEARLAGRIPAIA